MTKMSTKKLYQLLKLLQELEKKYHFNINQIQDDINDLLDERENLYDNCKKY